MNQNARIQSEKTMMACILISVDKVMRLRIIKAKQRKTPRIQMNNGTLILITTN